jgi:hypothetical protein
LRPIPCHASSEKCTEELGSRLKLPEGWRYSAVVPEGDLTLGANGTAMVVQDDLDNTYQKLD